MRLSLLLASHRHIVRITKRLSMKSIFCALVGMVGWLLSQSALAAPVGCIPGYQDNTCIKSIAAARQVPPSCPATAGWTTTGSAQWMGSGYTQPQCSYQAPPSCPPNYTQSAAPAWNGSSWVGLSCTPSVPPTPQCVDGPRVNVVLISWNPMYGYYWFQESMAGATPRTCGGVAGWSTLLHESNPPDELFDGGTVKAYPVHGVSVPNYGGYQVFATDITCFGPSGAYNGDNGPIARNLQSPPFSTSSVSYGVVDNASQCTQDSTAQ